MDKEEMTKISSWQKRIIQFCTSVCIFDEAEVLAKNTRFYYAFYELTRSHDVA